MAIQLCICVCVSARIKRFQSWSRTVKCWYDSIGFCHEWAFQMHTKALFYDCCLMHHHLIHWKISQNQVAYKTLHSSQSDDTLFFGINAFDELCQSWQRNIAQYLQFHTLYLRMKLKAMIILRLRFKSRILSKRASIAGECTRVSSVFKTRKYPVRQGQKDNGNCPKTRKAEKIDLKSTFDNSVSHSQ